MVWRCWRYTACAPVGVVVGWVVVGIGVCAWGGKRGWGGRRCALVGTKKTHMLLELVWKGALQENNLPPIHTTLFHSPTHSRPSRNDCVCRRIPWSIISLTCCGRLVFVRSL